MSYSPADGERSAARGYQWQYDHAAARVYDALLARDLTQLRLVDPTAGRVDDLVLVRGDRVDAYQFKSSEHPGTITFQKFIRPEPVQTRGMKLSLARVLADGWERLRQQPPFDVHVHLVTQQIPSTYDLLTDRLNGPKHFAAFLSQVLVPLRTGELRIEDVDAVWHSALRKLREATGLTEKSFKLFVTALHMDFGTGSAWIEGHSQRRSDIESLAQSLYRVVANSSDVVELDTAGVLKLMGWTERMRLRSRHEFPINLDTYVPISSAVDALQQMLADRDHGYMAVVGPPGAGKSTLLSQVLTGSRDRVVRYYAYVPQTPSLRTAMTANAFLHDVVWMLNRRGLRTTDHLPPSNDTNALRQSLFDHLDEAGREYLTTGRRTIIVIDGLDHVDREMNDNEGLLAELPKPEELANGVVIVVGSRTLNPLNPQARMRIEESESIVDLRNHQLPKALILQVCARAPLTAHLPQHVYERIAMLSDGHPLFLGYLLNRLDSATVESAESILATTPAYTGDMADLYRAVWEDLKDEEEVIEILSICSRLRIGFKTEWFKRLMTRRTIRVFREKVLYLFRDYGGVWRFFHDSFRQFAVDRTALGDNGRPNSIEDAAVHKRVAELCFKSEDDAVISEEMYHRFRAGQHDKVLNLAELTTFREQHQQFRSLDLIRNDIQTALKVAASRGDVIAMMKMILALVEIEERSQSLSEVDFLNLLHDVGLVEQAIAYCGDASRIPLVYAYNFAANLAESCQPAGRLIFDKIDPTGLHNNRSSHESNTKDNIAIAWAKAAVHYRPLETVIAAARSLVEHTQTDTFREAFGFEIKGDKWHRYRRIMRVLIDTAVLHRDEHKIGVILSTADEQTDRVVNEVSDTQSDDQDTYKVIFAVLTGLLIDALSALTNLVEDTDDKQRHLDRLVKLTGQPMFRETILELAEVFAFHGMINEVPNLISRIDYRNNFTMSVISYDSSPEIIQHSYRYWRLYYLVAIDDVIPELEVSDELGSDDTINGIPENCDTDTIEFVNQIHFLVRSLAYVDATMHSNQPTQSADVWREIVRMLWAIKKPSGKVPPRTLWILEKYNSAMMRIVVDIACKYGKGIPQQLSDLLSSFFMEEPQYDWPLKTRLDLAKRLTDVGANVSWYQETIRTFEDYAATTDIVSRLEIMTDIASFCAQSGQIQKAQRVTESLLPMAFGVGYHNDHQFKYWVEWLAKTLTTTDGPRFLEDAEWMARLLNACVSEGKYLTGAADLPAAIVSADSRTALRVFEYLVRQGSVSHSHALAALLRALVDGITFGGMASVELATDITSEILVPAANSAYPKLAESLVTVAERFGGPNKAARVIETTATRIEKYALKKLRAEWRQGLGVKEVDSLKEEVNASHSGSPKDSLVLSDGQKLTRLEVVSRIQNVEDIIYLRQRAVPNSSFSWADLIAKQVLTVSDIQRLTGIFAGQSSQEVEVMVCLMEAAESIGDHDTALKLALDVTEKSPETIWLYGHQTTHRRAVAIAVRWGEHVKMCENLARYVVSNSWAPGLLLPELRNIAEILGPDTDVSSIWLVIRTYLEGIAEPLDLGDPNDLKDHGHYWWLLKPSNASRNINGESTPEVVLGELAVRHISHPTWLVRDSAIIVVARGLVAGNIQIIEALSKFSETTAEHNILESAGRCLAAANTEPGYIIPDSLLPLDRVLAEYPSCVIRDLAINKFQRPYRPLRQTYNLILPLPTNYMIDSREAFLDPHVQQYKILANYSDLNIEALLGTALQYASQAIDRLPENRIVSDSLSSVGMKHTHPSAKILASREAFGRVLADLQDAHLLDNIPLGVRRSLRTFDVDALTRTPSSRPNVVLRPSKADDISTIDWYVETESRIDQYLDAARTDELILVAAKLTVQYPYNLDEEFVLSPTTGKHPEEMFIPRECSTLKDLTAATLEKVPGLDEPLVVEHVGWIFCQLRSDWLSFRPDFAAALGWAPDLQQPGRWHTAGGELAVESVWWVDGWGRGDFGLHDTAAEGHAVILTSLGLADVMTACNEITLHYKLTRKSRDDQVETSPVVATRVHGLTALS